MDGSILNDWDFPVHEEMMQTKSGIEIPATMQKAIIRSDTNQPLATVGKKYTIVKHQDVVKSIRDAISKYPLCTSFKPPLSSPTTSPVAPPIVIAFNSTLCSRDFLLNTS